MSCGCENSRKADDANPIPSQMIRTLASSAALFLLGLLAPVWWSFLLAKSMLAIYLLLGSPAKPGHIFGWANILVPSVLIGLSSGAIVLLISTRRPLRGLAIFLGAFALGVITFAFIADSLDHILIAFADIGTVAFICGAAVLPISYAAKLRLA